MISGTDSDTDWTRWPAAPRIEQNGKGAAVARRSAEAKSVGLSPPVSFIPRDAEGRTIEHPYFGMARPGAEVSRATAYTVAAYCYVAMKFRADAMAEAPLMVVEETDDGEEWLKDHELAEFLDAPHPDFDMGELIQLSRLYRDMTGMCIWVKDTDVLSRTARLTPFSGEEFVVRQKGGRIYGEFELTAVRPNGADPRSRFKRPEQVVFFRELHPGDWWHGLAPVDVALGILNLGQDVTATAKSLLRNAVFPSIVVQTHESWRPDPQMWEEFKASLDEHALTANKGQPLALTGGGRATVVAAKIEELVPGELLDRVESTVAAIFNVPAIVLQFLVGLKNSPWSQMEEARRAAYEDGIDKLWTRDEKVLTRQLLRDTDDDPTHFIRFDRSRIRALKADDTKRAAVVSQLADVWTVDEGRIYTGQEPHEDPKIGGAIISHSKPSPALALPSGGQRPVDEDGDAADREVEEQSKAIRTKAANFRVALSEMVRSSAEDTLQLSVNRLLAEDRDAILDVARDTLGGAKADKPTPAQLARFRAAVKKHLEDESQENWRDELEPLIRAHALRAAEMVAADLGVSLQLLRPDVLEYAEKEVGWLVKEIAGTTRDQIADAISSGIEAGEGAMEMLRRLVDLPAFSSDRAKLVARTESTRVMNGAPTEALIKRQRETGRRYVKTWFAVLDSRTRDEHADMNGEQVPVDEKFSNGLMFPSQPNCRCTLITSAVEGL